MQVHFGLPVLRLGPTALAMGSFDGVHLGHRVTLSRAVEVAAAERLSPSLITFDPHPRCVLDPANCPQQITTLEERLAEFRPLGFEHAVVIEFTRVLAGLSAQEFMDRVLASMDLRHLVVGQDFALGRGRAGTVSWLREYGRKKGYEVDTVPLHQIDGEEVHSSEVRRLVTLGMVERAARLLGRPYTMTGLVEPGDRIGRQLGFPTANLAVPPGKLVPARGIYAGWARTPMGRHQAAISVGYRPQFDKTDLRVEAFLLDFDGDLYQRRLELEFVARLRDERRFPDVDALREAIAADVERVRRILDAG
jgi:riboflavin kinase/FMN adenylyltransferase